MANTKSTSPVGQSASASAAEGQPAGTSTAVPLEAANSDPSTSQATSVSNQQGTETPASSVEAPTAPTVLIKTPLPHPLPLSKPTPPPPLTAAQQQKYDELLTTVSAWTEVSTTSAKNAPKEPITEAEKYWLTRECLLRYLRATKWVSAAAAAQRLQQTLTWRREYGLHKFTPEYISIENETGKQVLLGYDNNARPCLYMNPSRQNTQRSDRQLHHLVYMLERGIDLMPPGVESLALLINFSDTQKGQNASVGQGRETLTILQGHYPERLGRALISELPWYINLFFKAISAFIDPVTREKMKFNEPLINHVPKEQLLKERGGAVEFEYDHSAYWPALASMCEQRRKEMEGRWAAAGKKVGESEDFLKAAEGAKSAFAIGDTDQEEFVDAEATLAPQTADVKISE